MESHFLELWAVNGVFGVGTENDIFALTDNKVLQKINAPNVRSGLTTRPINFERYSSYT